MTESISKKVLENLYVERRLSIEDIAMLLHYNAQTIRLHLRKHKITRPTSLPCPTCGHTSKLRGTL